MSLIGLIIYVGTIVAILSFIAMRILTADSKYYK